MQDRRNGTLGKAPISRKQRRAAVLAAGGFFGYLAVASLFHGNPTVRLLMIGHGISAGIWLAITLEFSAYWHTTGPERGRRLEAEDAARCRFRWSGPNVDASRSSHA